jgi:hypothetical protein
MVASCLNPVFFRVQIDTGFASDAKSPHNCVVSYALILPKSNSRNGVTNFLTGNILKKR